MRLPSPFARVLFAGFVLIFGGCYRELPLSVAEVVGPAWAAAGQVVTCSTKVSSSNYDQVMVRFAWGDGDTSEWIGAGAIGPYRFATHAWADSGHFVVKAQARDQDGRESEWLGGLRTIALDSSVVKWVKYVGKMGAVCPPVGPEGNVYVVTDDWAIGDYLVALDATGRWLWRRQVADSDRPPVVGADGSVYVFDSDLQVISPAGALVRVDTLVDGDYVEAPALGPDGAIYASRYDTLVCLNADGSPRWEYVAPAHTRGIPAIGTDTSICWLLDAPSDSPSVFVLKPDGSLKWTASVYDPNWVSAGDQGSFIVAGPDCYLFDAQGQETWLNHAEASGPAVVAPGSVFLVPVGRGLLCRQPDSVGEVKLGTFGFGKSVLVDAAGTGFAGADTGEDWYSSNYAIVMFDSTVENHRTIPVGSGIPGAPGIGPDGTVYIATQDGYLYALKGATGLADTPWPKYGHDSRNTSCAAGH